MDGAPLLLASSFAIGAWIFMRAFLAGRGGGLPRWPAFLAGVPGWTGRIRPRVMALQRQAGDTDRPPEAWGAYAAACGAAGALWGGAVGGAVGVPAGLLFAFLPVAVLSARAERRLAAVEGEFPFVVDLVGLSVAAGMTVEWAIRRVTPRLAEGPLKDEMNRLLAGRSVGQGWAEVLSGLADRTGSISVHDVAATLAQAESTGMSLSPILARLSADLRARQLAAAEARAHRAPVRMLFPIVLCILPAVFAVLLGPALHRLLG